LEWYKDLFLKLTDHGPKSVHSAAELEQLFVKPLWTELCGAGPLNWVEVANLYLWGSYSWDNTDFRYDNWCYLSVNYLNGIYLLLQLRHFLHQALTNTFIVHTPYSIMSIKNAQNRWCKLLLFDVLSFRIIIIWYLKKRSHFKIIPLSYQLKNDIIISVIIREYPS